MPVQNGIPSKHDPSLATDNDLSSSGTCSSSSGTVSELSDAALYQDVGDPVGLHNGMVSYRVTDLFITGRKLHIEFTRRYNSMFSHVDGPLGFGWDHNLNILLQVNLERTDVKLFNGNTRRDRYTRATPPLPAPGESLALDSPAGIFNRLFWGTPPSGGVNTFWVRGRHGTKTEFELSRFLSGSAPYTHEYRVKSIEDKNGNKQTFEYQSDTTPNPTWVRLWKVRDSLDRVIELLYDDTAHPTRVTRVKDFTGREIVYSYSGAGDLESVRTPVTTPTTENGIVFNDFAGGRIERYTYSSSATQVLEHNLLTVQRPAEDGSSPQQPALTFTYNPSNSSTGFLDWCSSQTLGGGTGSNAAGGTILYTYSTTSLPSGAAVRTTVSDRRGNETDYLFSTTGHALQIDEREGTTSNVLATTKFQYDQDGNVTRIERPLGNVEDRIYYDASHLPSVVQRYFQGNLTSIAITKDNVRPNGGTPSNTISVGFEWEPVFNHLCSRTDELGRKTEIVCDYMEGNTTLTAPLIAAELGISLGEATSIANLPGLLRDTDFNGDSVKTQANGNVVAILRPTATLSSQGSGAIGQVSREPDAQQESIDTFVYNEYGQMIARTNPEENTTVFLYYPETKPFDGTNASGGGTNTVTGGYLKRVDRDVQLPYTADAQLAGVNSRALASDFGRNTNQIPAIVTAKTDFVYDPVGNMLSLTDPRGVKTSLAINELNEVWKITRASDVSGVSTRFGGINGTAEDLTGQAFAYQEKRLYDKNGRLLKTYVQNSGNNADAGQVSGFLETEYVYDILSDVRQVKTEVGTLGETSTWQYAFDANQNLTDVTQPMGNVTRHTWDARDQLVKVQSGFTAPNTALETVEFTYDSNGNRVEVEDGLNNVTEFEFDGFDRVHAIEDALLNRKEFTRNAASLVDEVLEKGALTGTSGPGFNLRRTYFEYDAQKRLILTGVQDPQAALVDGALTPNDSNKVSRRIDYDRLGRVTFQIEDDLGVYETRYDGLNRVLKTIEPDVGADSTANTVDAHYDDNGNLVKVVETEEYPTGSTNPTRVFETFAVFDALDRRVSTTDNLGHTVRFEYDTRDNVVLSTDAKGPPSSQLINGHQVNGPGNATRYFHDGLDRLVTTEMDLTVGGVGNGGLDLSNPYNTDGQVTLVQKWDLNGRLIEQIDDRRKATKYEYDLADRMTLLRYADNKTIEYTHDAAGNVVQVTDARLNVIALGHDNLNRLTTVDVTTLAAPTVGTTMQRFEYDGLGRRTKEADSVDAVLNNGNDAVVERTYDALSRIKTDTQNGRAVTSTWKEEGKRTALSYSSTSNPLTVTYAHDVLDRISTLSAAGTQLADYTYAGPARLLKRTLTLSPTKSLIEKHYTGSFNDADYWDGARRPTRMETTNRIGTVTYTQFEHQFDANYNRRFERRVHDGSQGDNYVYDSLDRLVSFERKVPSTDIDNPGQNNAQTLKNWQLDGVQNWRSVTTNGVATAALVSAVNAYTQLTTNGITDTPSYDADGNLTSPNANPTPTVTLRYDFQNRLREISDTDSTVHHDYDASGRRIRTYTSGNVANCPPWVEYVHDGWEVIEEFDGSNTLMRRFVMGSELDEPLRMETFTYWQNPGTYFFQRSTLGYVVALSTSAGTVVERYTYDAYGAPRFEDANNAPIAGATYSQYGNPYLFTGRRYEPWIRNLYEFRHRFMDPALGRFVQRDPIGVWGDLGGLGNGLSYCSLSPSNCLDPYGLYEGEALVKILEGIEQAGHAVTQGVNDIFFDAPRKLMNAFGSEKDKKYWRDADKREDLQTAKNVGHGLAVVGGAALGAGGVVSTARTLATVATTGGGAAIVGGGVMTAGATATAAGTAIAGGAVATTGGVTGVRTGIDRVLSDGSNGNASSGGTGGGSGGGRGANNGTRSGDMPAKGKPNSTDSVSNGKDGGTIRDYGPEGRAKTDYDIGHNHPTPACPNGPGDPHAHDWRWWFDQIFGKWRGERLPGRPLKPGE